MYCKLHYHNITYRQTYYDVRILPCVLSVMSFMTPELVYIKVTFNALLLTKGSNSTKTKTLP